MHYACSRYIVKMHSYELKAKYSSHIYFYGSYVEENREIL